MKAASVRSRGHWGKRREVFVFRKRDVPSTVLRSLARQVPDRVTEHEVALAIVRYIREVAKRSFVTFEELRRGIPKFLKLSRYDLGAGVSQPHRWIDVLHNIGKHQDGSPYNACQLGILRWIKGEGFMLLDDDLLDEKYIWFVCLASRGKDLPRHVLAPSGDFTIISEATKIIERNSTTGRVALSYLMTCPIIRNFSKTKVCRALERTSDLAGGVRFSGDRDDPILTLRVRTKSAPVRPLPRSSFLN